MPRPEVTPGAAFLVRSPLSFIYLLLSLLTFDVHNKIVVQFLLKSYTFSVQITGLSFLFVVVSIR